MKMPPLYLPPMRAKLEGALDVDPLEKRLLIRVGSIFATEDTALAGLALANFARWKLREVQNVAA